PGAPATGDSPVAGAPGWLVGCRRLLLLLLLLVFLLVLLLLVLLLLVLLLLRFVLRRRPVEDGHLVLVRRLLQRLARLGADRDRQPVDRLQLLLAPLGGCLLQRELQHLGPLRLLVQEVLHRQQVVVDDVAVVHRQDVARRLELLHHLLGGEAVEGV